MTKLLIADDDSLFRSGLVRRLKRLNIDLEEVSNVKDLIRKARTQKYNILITDYDMGKNPEEKGTYAIKEIRKFDIITPIVFHSSFVSTQLLGEALSLGANYVLGKNETDALIRIVNQQKSL